MVRPDPVVVLAHPVVIGSLTGWLINDWFLKARFGNEVTGKLSDVFAMVVFPLLIAVVASRISRYPLRWGLGVNTVFFAAINLSASVDRFVENALSLIVPSTLTMDATDLAVLPFMAVALQVWNRAHESSSNARQIARLRIGRVVFAVGALTCMATSAPEATRNAEHTGSMVLTADQPVVTMPLEYDLKGNPNPHLEMDLAVTAYGNGADGEVPYRLVDWNATTDELSFELTDPAWAPVHVEWTATALGEPIDCFFRCNHAKATMSIDVPPLASKPIPDHTINLPRTANGEETLVYINFVVDKDAPPPELLLPRRSDFAAIVDGNELTRRESERTWPIVVAESCADPCRVVIPVTYNNRDYESETTTFGLFGAISSVEVRTPPLIETRAELVIPIDEVEVGARARFAVCLHVDFPSETPIALAGIGLSFDTAFEPPPTSVAVDNTGCLIQDQIRTRPDDVAGHDQIVVTAIVKTTEEIRPEDLEIVIIE